MDNAFLVAMDLGFRRVQLVRFETEAAACAASKRLWCSWVLFSLDEESSSGWSEVECGGMGFGHNKLRRRIAKLATDTADLPEMVKEEEPADDVAAELRERAEAVDDAALAEPLRSAICSMESALATVGSAVKKCKCAAPPAPAVPGAPAAHTDSSVRALLGAAIAQPTDEEAVCELIALMQGGLDGAAGADELVDVLVRSFISAPPTDAEMVVLRRLQERWSDRGGLESYAVATAWLAALFVRTERCIAARSRLDECVRAMNAEQRSELQRLGERLVATELPELLQSLADVATFVQKIEQSIGFQEVSVRSAKGVSAGLSLTGTAMAFTPLCAVGFGLLAAGAGVGVTTATGDALGQHVQKEELRRRLALLGVAEEKVQHQLRALLAFSFPGVQPEEFVEASAPLRFGAALPEMLVGSAVVHAGGAAARVAPGLLSRVGLTVASRSLSVVGAVVSTGDFIHSVVTSNPNREILGKVHAYLEGEAETSRAWWVLLCHWLSQAPQQRASTPGGEEPDGATRTVGGDASQEPAGDRGDDHALQQARLQSSMMSAMESRLSKDLASACSEPCGDPAAARG